MKKTDAPKENDSPKKHDAEMLVDALCGVATPEEADHVSALLTAERIRIDGLKQAEVEKKSIAPDSGDIKGRSNRPIS
jgi:hypothetical protein